MVRPVIVEDADFNRSLFFCKRGQATFYFIHDIQELSSYSSTIESHQNIL